jgi:outer membrane protein TolC
MIQIAACFILALSTPEPTPGFTLEQAVSQALTRNERAQIAGEDVAIADARAAAARTFFFPSLTAAGTYTRRAWEIETTLQTGERVVMRRHNALTGVLDLKSTLFDATGIPLYRQALRERESATLSAAEARRLLAFDTAAAFLSVLGSEQVRDAASRRRDFARQSLADATARFKAQLAGSNDVTRIDLEVAQAEMALVQAQRAVETQYLQLGQLVAAPVQPPLAMPTGLFDAAEAVPASEGSLADVARRRRLDARSLGRHIEGLRQGALEPSLRLIPSLGMEAQITGGNEPGFGGHRYDGFAGATLTWTLFDRGLRYAQKHEREAQLRQGRLRLSLLGRQIGPDLASAAVSLAKTRDALVQASDAADAADRNAQETHALYREGLANALSVEDASVRRFDAQVQLAQQQFGLAVALLGLRAAEGLDPFGREPQIDADIAD